MARPIRKLATQRYLTRRILDVFRQHVSAGRKTALEVGCGGGAWMALLGTHLGLHVWGLDYSMVGCQLARQRLAFEGMPQRIVCGDIFSAPFVAQSFDIVYALGVIEHFRDPTEIMKAMVRLLKPGGQLIVGVPNMKGLVGYLHELADPDLSLRHVLLTPQDIAHLCRELQLDVQYADYVGTLCLGGPNWARRIGSRTLSALLRQGLAGLDTVLTWPLRVLNLQWESPYVSPYVMVVGRKPLHVSDQGRT